MYNKVEDLKYLTKKKFLAIRRFISEISKHIS